MDQMTNKPIDIQHEETVEEKKPEDLTIMKTEQLDRMEKNQEQIVGILKEIVSFIKDLPKADYEVEKDGKKVQKEGPLWTLIKRAKKIGAF